MEEDHRLGQTAAGTKSRLLSVIFLAVVTTCLGLPFLQTLHPIFGTVVAPVDEYRPASPLPSPRLLLKANSEFVDRLNKWFDDRAGFRDLLIRTKNQIDYSVFSSSRKVYVGSNGWLFERDPGLPLERLDGPNFDALKDRFLTLARRLQEKNIKLVVVGYPDKSQVYPEMVPPDGRLLLPGGNHDKLRRFLAEQSDLIFIDVEELLRRERQTATDPLFFKTDLHTSTMGQVVVATNIIARLAEIEGVQGRRWEEKFERGTIDWTAGNEARFLAPLVPVVEHVAYLNGTYVLGREDMTGQWNVHERQEILRIDESLAPLFEWEFRTNPPLCGERLPGVMLWGNSFADLYPAVGLHRYFCNFRRIHIRSDALAYDRLEKALQAVPGDTRYFIFQYWAPLLHYAPFVGFPHKP
jgi:hypothetical protein